MSGIEDEILFDFWLASYLLERGDTPDNILIPISLYEVNNLTKKNWKKTFQQISWY